AASGHRARRPSLPRDRAAGCEVPPSRRSCVLRDMLGGNAASGRHTHDTSNTKTQILTFIPNPLSRKNKKPAEGGLDSSGPITGSARRDWQPRMDSNHRMPESESGALPLGDGASMKR